MHEILHCLLGWWEKRLVECLPLCFINDYTILLGVSNKTFSLHDTQIDKINCLNDHCKCFLQLNRIYLDMPPDYSTLYYSSKRLDQLLCLLFRCTNVKSKTITSNKILSSLRIQLLGRNEAPICNYLFSVRVLPKPIGEYGTLCIIGLSLNILY